jgi:hypothetical protein
MDQGMASAIRRFPTRQSAIEELAIRDESFRSLCVDFGEAEAAWQRWEASLSPQRLQRQAEYGELVEGLAGEIEAAIDTAAPLRRP